MSGLLPPRVRRSVRLALRRPGLSEGDVDTELALHLELRAEQLVAMGWSRDDAEAEARRRFGPSWDDAVQHLHKSGRAREDRIAMRERLDSIWQDARYALRVLGRAPRFTIAAVLTLALGMGTTTVIYSLVDHVVLRPLPYRDPAQLVLVREVVGGLSATYPTMPANASHFLDWQRACTACEGLAAVKRSRQTLVGRGDPERLGAARVTSNLFSLLGVRPQLGRDFREEESQAGRDGVVILSDDFWRREFNADPNVLGRVLRLNDQPVEVIGVMPPSFTLPTGDALGALVGLSPQLDMYRPLAFTEHERTAQGEFDYAVIGRLKPGATPEQARSQVDAAEQRLVQLNRGYGTLGASLVSMREQVVGGAGRPLLLLLGAVGAVLLIVCVNLANLSLARNASRQHESAIRVALGAGRARIARLALIESLVIALGGGVLGLLFARWGMRMVVTLAPDSLPRLSEVHLDGRVFAASALLTMIVGIMVGALPAWRAAQSEPGESLKAGGRTAAGVRGVARRRAWFIGAQVGFTTVLLVGAGLFLSSFVRVLRVERGFDTDHVLAAEVALPYASYTTPEMVLQFYDRALAEVRTLPGVTGAAITSALPLEGESWVNGIGTPENPEKRAEANFRFVTPTYFAVAGTPLRSGSSFTEADRGRRLVVVSEKVARAMWPGQGAIGRQLTIGGEKVAEVVGVAADVRTTNMEGEEGTLIYLPSWENPQWQASVVVRGPGDPAQLQSSVRSALRRADATVPVPRIRTMSQVLARTLAARRFQLLLFGLFALMALVTASIGIYGVISQSLAGRTKEFGLRMALGARPSDVQGLVMREGLTPVALGLLAGVVGSLLAGQAVQGLLFGVAPNDLSTLLGVCAVLGTVGVIACAIPARRVGTLDLGRMLRPE
ncbi:MAG: hypothetical protein JWO05_1080 [Gemmatimonadetes bacterium]|nr:hypothetical protein [Gemmatimonadota bacterium]